MFVIDLMAHRNVWYRATTNAICRSNGFFLYGAPSGAEGRLQIYNPHKVPQLSAMLDGILSPEPTRLFCYIVEVSDYLSYLRYLIFLLSSVYLDTKWRKLASFLQTGDAMYVLSQRG